MTKNADRGAGFLPGEMVEARVSVQGLHSGETYRIVDRYIGGDQRVEYVLERVGKQFAIRNLPLLVERIQG